VRVGIDTKDKNASQKRWDLVRKGVPLIVEIGGREASGGQVSFLRRDKLYNGEKAASTVLSKDEFVAQVGGILDSMQSGMLNEARTYMRYRITDTLTSWDELKVFFGASVGDDEDGPATDNPGWVRASWCRPDGAEMEKIEAQLASLKITIRNAPLTQPKTYKPCIFTGKPGVEEILIARSY
jgi:prolyl-tRNA synthetase